jgi:SAM-dependent methyltransferase
VEWIYEFGTGTGRYLYHLAHMFPRTRLVGLDWTNASVAILRLIAEAVDRPIGALQFDMLRPNPDVRLESDSAVVTVGSMEQLGDGFGPFLDYLLAGTPRVVVHFEPIVEFYRDDCLFDYLAILYHDQRRYLRGYYPALQGLAANGQIEILEARRFYYGDLYNEGSSLVVWRPRGG